MELVDHQHHARQRFVWSSVAIARQILNSHAAIQVAALLEQLIEPLQHANAELAVALDRDDPRVWQPLRGIRLELNPFLEVDQIKLDLVRRVVERGVRDECMQQRRLARTSLPRDENVLRRSLAEPQMLQLGRPGATNGDVESRAGTRCPIGFRRRHDSLEWHFDATH